MKFKNFITPLHKASKRNYIERMINKKVLCMGEAKKYSKNYWDGPRKYGYGGYKFIPGRWTKMAKQLIKTYSLTNKSKILDVGSGKGFLLYEIKKVLPHIEIVGFDISKYAIKNAHKNIKKNIFYHKAEKKYPFKKNYFDFCLSIGCLHNLEIFELEKAINEICRVSKKQYIVVESYRTNKELFNLQCWALTCESFFSKKEWVWLFKHFRYNGDLEFIYFE
tara:strand:+ start:282 stop:944 length:663 start_codon:yes stop_codon:yes gene_type:complete